MSDKKGNEPGFVLTFDFDTLSAIEYAEFIDASREFGQNARRAVKTISETLARAVTGGAPEAWGPACILNTYDAADELHRVHLGGPHNINKKNIHITTSHNNANTYH